MTNFLTDILIPKVIQGKLTMEEIEEIYQAHLADIIEQVIKYKLREEETKSNDSD